MKYIEIPALHELFLGSNGVSTDSRKIEHGTLFFALKGETFNGNNFAAGAIEQGASYAVVDDEMVYEANASLQEKMILVEDVLHTLQQLARYNRLQYKIPVIALTGTNGKTTTKELITAALSAKYNVVATAGNLNNHIGVPLTLLRINSTTQVAVIEMGASAPGEINLLASLVCPSFGLITNVGKAHLLGFGSFEGVKAAKGELYDNLTDHKKIAFVNVDNPHLLKMAHDRLNLHIVPYGLNNNCARVIDANDENPFLKLTIPNPCMAAACGDEPMEFEVNTNLIGTYNADNVLAALCIATYFDVPTAMAIKAIEEYVPSNNRSQMSKTEHNTLIIDAYNANPTSMAASLENFNRIKASKKVLVLGDMLELGQDSLQEHCTIIGLALSLKPQMLLLVGGEFQKAFNELSGSGKIVDSDIKVVRLFENSIILRERLLELGLKGCTLLIKGSRGIRLERVFDAL
ncbi:MAG: UDP-N-acetylmuramoyl-tripeptide--D-alanyl-D-alanine ligase [Bacteroidales bacterium]|nr:UDP-N-acetylmuramoyl-tripeptide--D-alanyl-D-alanine ligase [Bacteroidales bacterium]